MKTTNWLGSLAEQLAVLPVEDVVLRGTAVVAITAIICRLLRSRTAAIRHRVWVAGLTAALIIPPVTLCGLAWPPLFSDAPRQRATLPVPQSPRPLSVAEAPGRSPEDDRAATGQASIGSAGEGQRPRADATAAPKRPNWIRWVTLGPKWKQLLGGFWLCGTLIAAIRFVTAQVRQTRTLRMLPIITDSDWLSDVGKAADALGLRRRPVTRMASSASVPSVVGSFCPQLVIPSSWRGWELSQRRCVLLHELAHIKRGDVAAQLIARLALIAYWFHPLVWYAVGQLQAERELAADDCVLVTGEKPSRYAEQLLRTLQHLRGTDVPMGVAAAHSSARLDRRVLAILDPRRRRAAASKRWALLLTCVAGIVAGVLGGAAFSERPLTAAPPAPSAPHTSPSPPPPVWIARHAIKFANSLPVSVAFSADGKTLVTGDTRGEVMALMFRNDTAGYRWKTLVGGSHAAVAVSHDQRHVYATTDQGMRILDLQRGKETARLEDRESTPTAIGVFPATKITEQLTRIQVVLGSTRGYFIPSWISGRLSKTLGSIRVRNVADNTLPPDPTAVPLAVDPRGTSAIMVGPVDAEGQLGGVPGEHILWAYACGNHEAGSPGNREMVGHNAPVVSAAWAGNGKVAATGDAAGRVIVWDAESMKERHRIAFSGRVAALALSADGERVAAYITGAQGRVSVWNTNEKPAERQLAPIHVEQVDLRAPRVHASLAFAPDGRRLAGCVVDKQWLNSPQKRPVSVYVWELSVAPAAQPAPQQAYDLPLPPGSPGNFVIIDDHSLIVPATKNGALDFRSLATGRIDLRLRLGEFKIGKLLLSSDRKWLAIEQRALLPPETPSPPQSTFDVGLYESMPMGTKGTIPNCQQLLAVAAGGRALAVVREKRIEIWDAAAGQRQRAAPLAATQLRAAEFSPDGQLLALADDNAVILWRWQEQAAPRRLKRDRSPVALAFSPDNRYLAEGYRGGPQVSIRSSQSQQTQQTLMSLGKPNDDSREIARIVAAQNGRLLIAGDSPANANAHAGRIRFWDTFTGTITRDIETPHQPRHLEVSPNGRYLVATLQDRDSGMHLVAWRLDGKTVPEGDPDAPPASSVPFPP